MESVSKKSPIERGYLCVPPKSPTEMNQKDSERENNFKNLHPNPDAGFRIAKSINRSPRLNDEYSATRNRFNNSSLSLKNRDEVQYEQDPKLEERFNPLIKQDLNNEGKNVTKASAYQLVNDLGFLLSSKSKASRPNVKFEIFTPQERPEPKIVVDFHSVVLLAQSAWFRRSWRCYKSNTENNYDFNYFTENRGLGRFAIKYEQLPEEFNGLFIFSMEIEKFDKEFISAFSEFKKFLYRGDCEVTQLNAKFLLFYAHAFINEALFEFMKIQMKANLPQQSLLGILEFLELAYIYEIEDLKTQCFKLIQESKDKIIKTRAWKEISTKYPKLILEAFLN